MLTSRRFRGRVVPPPSLRKRNTSSSTPRVRSPVSCSLLFSSQWGHCCCCCGHACLRLPALLHVNLSHVNLWHQYAGSCRNTETTIATILTTKAKGNGRAAAVPRCYSHVSKTIVLSWHLCPNRWSACPVSRRHLPRVRATEPEAMLRKALRLCHSLHQRSMQQQHSARPNHS